MERKIKRLWRRMLRRLCGRRFGKRELLACCLFSMITVIFVCIFINIYINTNKNTNTNKAKKDESENIREAQTEILEHHIKEEDEGKIREGNTEERTEEGESLLTEKEKEQLQEMALEAAEQAADIYKDIEIEEGPSFASNIKNFTQEQCREAACALGRAGYTSITAHCDMENPEEIERFYEAYLEKQDAAFTVFDVQQDGLIGVKTLLYGKNRLQIYYIEIGWKEGGVPEVRNTSINDLKEIKLTEKGYFIYQYENSMPHSYLRQFWRVKPLSDKCRELTEKYIAGLSYVNYNVLITNWDGSNVEDILMPCMFEDIYRIATGENIRPENGMIPADLYEKIMAAYFPVSVSQIRKCCGYDESRNAYPYEMILGRQYPPFGEVVDYAENADGTITLTVDGVWADYNSDRAFVNTVVVMPFQDGTFRYLSNFVEEKELELPSVAEVKEYDISVSERERREAEQDCNRMMGLVFDLYKQTEREEKSDVVLSDEMVLRMQDRIGETGRPVTSAVLYADMENYRQAEKFLKECKKGKWGDLKIYKIRYDGGIGQSRFVFNGKDMYVLTANAVWDEDYRPKISYVSCAKIKEWDYTENGWFAYQVCVPEYPEVTEIVDGSCLVRIRPMTNRRRELSEKCVKGLGYSGNNLLCSDWDEDHMDRLDYNSIYEYLYMMKYQQEFPAEDYREGIPAEAFESLIMEYLPVEVEQIREYAAFDEKEQAYEWNHLRGGEYVLNFFETSLPEVVKIRENEDGTVTLTVNAVCDTVLCDDAVITHELTVRFAEDGSFQYLGNKILQGKENLPAYQYRAAGAYKYSGGITGFPPPTITIKRY